MTEAGAACRASDAITLTANGGIMSLGKEGGRVTECVCLKWPMCLKCAAQYLLILLSAPVVWRCGYGLM